MLKSIGGGGWQINPKKVLTHNKSRTFWARNLSAGPNKAHVKAYCHIPNNEVIESNNKTETNKEGTFFHTRMAIHDQDNENIEALCSSSHKVDNKGDYIHFQQNTRLIDNEVGGNDCDTSNNKQKLILEILIMTSLSTRLFIMITVNSLVQHNASHMTFGVSNRRSSLGSL